MGTTKFILTCSCRDMPKFAQDAFSILFPDELNPEVYAGSDSIYSLYKRYPNDGDFSRYVHSLSRNKTKFAYLVERGDDGSLVRIIDLKTAREVA